MPPIGTFTWFGDANAIPPLLLATVLLTELRHYNLIDDIHDPMNLTTSVGIAQITTWNTHEIVVKRPPLVCGTRILMTSVALGEAEILTRNQTPSG